MPTRQNISPAHDELEISIFGPGYGEAILLHLGTGKWILVDSCIDPASKQPAPLKYLSDLNVDVADNVELIVTTHWHSDHIRGISSVVKECRSAKFVMSDALCMKEFVSLIEVYSKPRAIKNSPIAELSKALEILKARKDPNARVGSAKLAIADRLLYQSKIDLAVGPIEVKVFALSPSDDAVQQARLVFTRWLPEEMDYLKWIPPLTPNHASVVLWIEVGNHKILLGADLEETGDPNIGWSAIVNNSILVLDKASIFKIPHHGSENAHHDHVWSKLLSDEPFAALTPYNRGKKPLPSRKDIERINTFTPNAFATAPTRRRRPQWQNRVVKDVVEQMTRSIQDVYSGWGHVRYRKKMSELDTNWQVELFGDAYPLTN